MVNGNTLSATTQVAGISKVQRRETMPTRDKRARFAKVISEFSEKRVAHAADCTVQAVRKWKSEQQFISGDKLIDLAREIPQVKQWLYSEIERGTVSEFDGDPRALDAIVRAVVQRLDGRG